MNNESKIPGKKRSAVRKPKDISATDMSHIQDSSANSPQLSSAKTETPSSGSPHDLDMTEETIMFDTQKAEQAQSFKVPGRAVKHPQIKKPKYENLSETSEFEEAPIIRPSQSREDAENNLKSVQDNTSAPRENSEIFISPLPNSRKIDGAELSASASPSSDSIVQSPDIQAKYESPTSELNILMPSNNIQNTQQDANHEMAVPASSSKPQVVKNARLSRKTSKGSFNPSQTIKNVSSADVFTPDITSGADNAQYQSWSNPTQNPNSLRAKVSPIQPPVKTNSPSQTGSEAQNRQQFSKESDTVMFNTGSNKSQQKASSGNTQNDYRQSGYNYAEHPQQGNVADNQTILVQNQTPSPSAVRGINYEYVKNINDKNAPVSYHSSSGKTNRSNSKSNKNHSEKEQKPASNTLASVVKALVYITAVFVVSVVSAIFAISVGNDVFAFVKSDAEYEVTIPEYATLDDITGILHENGIIKYPEIFKIYSYLRKDNGKFIAGTYTVSPSLDYDDLLAEFKEKAPVNVELSITIPEGYTVDEIIDLFISKGMSSREDLIDVIQNYDFDFWFVKELTDLPESRKYRLEGYLFPDTYYFYSNSSAENIIYKLLSNFDTKVPESYKERCNELNMTLDQIITLASMIQMEAKYSDEYGKVSSVFHNRLNNPSVTNGKLESDATIQYSLNERKTELGQSDLDLDNPYNTYLYDGLPPGPISNPSLNAINWAMYPDKTNYYFFVATSSGRSLFAETLEQHNENKRVANGQ